MRTIHVNDVYAKICQRLLAECGGVVSGRKEMEALAPAHIRYVDWERHVHERWKRILYLLRLVGPRRAAEIMQADSTGILREAIDNPPRSDDGRSVLPLWKAMREFLREEDEATVGEVQTFLNWLGFKKVNRQSIESAIKRHENTFRVRTKGRERIVSLKGQEDDSSDEAD